MISHMPGYIKQMPKSTAEARNMLKDKVFAEYEKLIGEPVTRRNLS